MIRFTISLLAGVAALGFASSAFAADLIVDEPAMPGVVAASGNWDGAYIGVFGGYGAATFTDDEEEYFGDVDATGYLLGITAGANFSLSEGIVGGVVGDVAWSNMDGYDSNYDSNINVNWLGSLRGTLGFDGGSIMPYLTAGLAFANATIDQYDGYRNDSQTHIGWTVGAGIAIAVTDNMSIDLLYRYSDYGTKDYDLYYDSESIGLTSHTAQVGLNWKF